MRSAITLIPVDYQSSRSKRAGVGTSARGAATKDVLQFPYLPSLSRCVE